MLWWPIFFLLRLDEVLVFLAYMFSLLREDGSLPTVDPHPKFFEQLTPFFSEDFLSRFPQEAYPWRLKIFSYLAFNLLVKGHGKTDNRTSEAWRNYNGDDFYRTVVDAVFYEYLTNFTDKGYKDSVFNPLEDVLSNPSNPQLNEEIAVDRIGQYLDLLSDTKSRAEIKRAKSILSETSEHPAMPKRRTTECEVQPLTGFPGIPGIDYPNFCDIPKTSFSCADNKVPGIYADYETGCQAFHVCWPHRIDTFLCPIGTIFNQTLLTCDLWYDTGCFSSPSFQKDPFLIDGFSIAHDIPKFDGTCESLLITPLRLSMKFIPEKCEVKDILGRKVRPRDKDVGELKARLEMAFSLIKDVLQMLAKMKNEFNDVRNPRILALAKHLKSLSESNSEMVEEATEFTKKLGETDFRPPQVAEKESRLEELQLVTRSIPLKPSKSSGRVKSPRKQKVPEIVIKSMELGGSLLSEGILPLAKQIMIDSYRKIESKKL